jgi:Gpi18-like mannosyltransferase
MMNIWKLRHNFLLQTRITVGTFGLILLAIFLRLIALPNRSNDYKNALSPWYDFIVQHGYFSALQYNFSDYTPADLYWLVIAATFLAGLPKVFSIKLFAITIDFVCAFWVAKLVALKYPQSDRPTYAFLATLFLPTVMINSALWGQCDVIYTTGLVACLFYLSTDRRVFAMIAYGVAFAFKLQAIFLTPLFIILLIQRGIQWYFLGLIPGVYFLSVIPAWIAGRPLKDLLLIYANQADSYSDLSLNFPGLYEWISNDFYNFLMPVAVVMTGSMTLIAVYILSKYPLLNHPDKLIEVGLFFCLFVPFFLPKMHDRYFFPADILSMTFGFYQPAYFWVPIIVQVASLISYAGGDFEPLIKYGSIGIGFTVWTLWRKIQ